MSMDGCDAGFSRDEQAKFVDAKLEKALDRIEKDAMLRQAGIENLVRCPFCDFAAECVSVEIDREFRCQAPECMITSCRFCHGESHLPLSCEESAQKQESARHSVEEAMTAALIRNCNKCECPLACARK